MAKWTFFSLHLPKPGNILIREGFFGAKFKIFSEKSSTSSCPLISLFIVASSPKLEMFSSGLKQKTKKLFFCYSEQNFQFQEEYAEESSEAT